jgi:hypothetical protein
MAAIVTQNICIFSSFTSVDVMGLERGSFHLENRPWSRLNVVRPELWPAVVPQRHRNGWPFQAGELLD